LPLINRRVFVGVTFFHCACKTVSGVR
jgi:hypothetical protein